MQRMLGLENDHPGFGERALSTFLRSVCCDAPVLLWAWEAGDMNMSHCTGCRALIGSPTGEDMDLIKRDLLPYVNPLFENIFFVEEDPQKAFRNIRV